MGLRINDPSRTTATTTATDDYLLMDGTVNGSRNYKMDNIPKVTSGIVAPTSTPAKIGDIYVDTVLKQTYVANGTVSSANWIKQNGSYQIASCGIFTALSPTDSTSYYFGGITQTFTTVGGARKMYITKSGTITNIFGDFRQQIGATNETSSLYIRVNDTTDYLISSGIKNDTAVTSFSNVLLNIPVVAGNYIELKWTTPAWATNATGVIVGVYINIDL